MSPQRTSDEMSPMRDAKSTAAESAVSRHRHVSRGFCGRTSPYPAVESTVIVKYEARAYESHTEPCAHGAGRVGVALGSQSTLSHVTAPSSTAYATRSHVDASTCHTSRYTAVAVARRAPPPERRSRCGSRQPTERRCAGRRAQRSSRGARSTSTRSITVLSRTPAPRAMRAIASYGSVEATSRRILVVR